MSYQPDERLVGLLAELEQELRRLGLWGERPPPAEALASPLPFCYDTLALEEWLQWVFLPQLRQLLALGATLPGDSAIAPLAELEYAESALDVSRLLALLEQVDQALCARPSSTQ